MSRKQYLPPQKGPKDRVASIFLLIALVVISVVFQIAQPRFLTVGNIMNLLGTSSVVGILALGNMILMAAGEMSFSVGAQCTVIGALFGKFLISSGINNIYVSMAVALLASAVIGLFLAFCTVKIGVPTFVCSLAVATILDGFSQLLNSGTTLFSPDWPKNFTIMQHRIGGQLPVAFVVFVVLAIIVHLVYEHMSFGRYIYAIGSNPTAADNCGISVPKMRVAAFVISAVFCGMGGIVAASYNNSVSLTMGNELLLPAIAATMLSATFLQIGKYNVPGVVLSAILMIVIQNGVIAAGYPIYVKDVVQGVLLTIAVAIIALIKEDGLPTVKLDA